ncbi:carboxypeptidase S [Auriculariales sp. MPI-PUGE-AT-0066]|nr:carboxypeptidase S [Auriculariales sp. MPI-PUGE-AT-0066]
MMCVRLRLQIARVPDLSWSCWLLTTTTVDTTMGKAELPVVNASPPRSTTRFLCLRNAVLTAFAVTAAAAFLLQPDLTIDVFKPFGGTVESQSNCAQPKLLVPSHSLIPELDELYATESFKNKSAEWLSGAVKIPTESYDEMDAPDKDPRWNVFLDFHNYLEAAFPLVHSKFTLTKVNTIGLIYEWAGSDSSLKPVFLAAHQDVVPVEPKTAEQWIHPPYSGLYDGTWIWGRGSSDDKSGLISIMITLETLINKGFTPTRSIVLGFGFDEETGGKAGALSIAEYLLEKYGENSFSLIIDEGGGFSDQNGITVATPGVAEKGYLDVRVQVNTLGGHSSVPPPHTGIGILASVISRVERHPTEPKITRDSTTFEALQCLAEHAPNLSPTLRKNVKKSVKSDKALKHVEKEYLTTLPVRSLVSTTQAVDIISGGVKINALPEQVYAIINHRIATHSSVSELQARVTKLIAPVAHRHNVSLNSFGKNVQLCSASCCRSSVRAGSIVLSEAFHSALEPAPRTPTDPSAAPYALLGGTIRAAYAKSYDGKDIIVAPGMSTGNTDTKRYWKLTPHIFRYNHKGPEDGYNGAHTVNEGLRATALPGVVRFFTYLLLNLEETETIA